MTVVCKLGSSIVAASDGSLREDVLDSVCSQVSTLHGAGGRVILVTSGAIARGMRLMGMEARPAAIDELQAASAVGQGDLFRSYESRLAAGDVRAAQVLLTAADLQIRDHWLNAQNTLKRLLDWGVVPVVNENDTTATDEITFGDNDFLAAQVAMMMDARVLVLLTDIAGLHDADPREQPDAELIEEVTDPSSLAALEIGDGTSPFGLGGMRSKVAAAEMAGASGIETVICDGTAEGSLGSAAAGERVGTRFAAHAERDTGFKLWLRHAKPAKGRVLIDQGAAEQLRESGSSLLPVGVVSVEGEFLAGDAVEVVHEDTVVGKGIVSWGAAELKGIAGMRSDEIAERIPDAAAEAVHRDRFVLT